VGRCGHGNMADDVDVNAKGQVASIPRRILDPRRPIGKPTSADKEEMLLPYDSVIPIDSKRIISHTYPVCPICISSRSNQRSAF
jgi:hypothetical protein